MARSALQGKGQSLHVTATWGEGCKAFSLRVRGSVADDRTFTRHPSLKEGMSDMHRHAQTCIRQQNMFWKFLEHLAIACSGGAELIEQLWTR